MPSLYSHPELAKVAAEAGVCDRFVRRIKNTFEQVITIIVGTHPRGAMVFVLTLDLVGPDEGSVLSVPIVYYPWNSQLSAHTDAVLLGRQLGLAVRAADSPGGWTQLWSPDGPKVIDSARMSDIEA